MVYESQHQHGAIDKTGGFKDFLFSPLPGEMIPFDAHIFQMGWFNHQLVGMIFSKNLFVFGAPQDVIAGDGKFPTMNESM